MDDRVAEVLARRAALDRGPVPAVLLSILLHGSLIGAAAWVAMRHPAPQAMPMVNIQFAPQDPAPVVPKPGEQKPKVAAPRIEEPKPVVETPPPTPAPVVPEKNTVPLSPFGKSTKKGSEAPPLAPPTAAPEQPTAPVAPAVPVGGSGVAGLEGGDFPYTVYLEQMQRNIGKQWLRPLMHGEPAATIYFRIQRDGTITDARIAVPSISGVFDRNALRAVMAASPLPPLPYGYNGKYLGVHLQFR